MNLKALISDKRKMAGISMGIIFLALIRTISEPFRLQYYSSSTLTFENVKPFLLGSLVSAFGLFAMAILFYYGRYKSIIAVCIVTIAVLLILKGLYRVQ
jgi:hypothetical protein